MSKGLGKIQKRIVDALEQLEGEREKDPEKYQFIMTDKRFVSYHKLMDIAFDVVGDENIAAAYYHHPNPAFRKISALYVNNYSSLKRAAKTLVKRGIAEYGYSRSREKRFLRLKRTPEKDTLNEENENNAR